MAFPFSTPLTNQSVDDVAHIIQVALTPVFVLSGIGTLLNLFNTRLARVSDHLEAIASNLKDEEDSGGAPTCGAALALFLGSLRNTASGSWLNSGAKQGDHDRAGSRRPGSRRAGSAAPTGPGCS